MKPEHANLFVFNTTGPNSDVIASFFYEWQDCQDGTSMELIKQQVASVVLTLDDTLKMIDVLNEYKEKLVNGGVTLE